VLPSKLIMVHTVIAIVDNLELQMNPMAATLLSISIMYWAAPAYLGSAGAV
jgi:hypothetical protein